MSEQPRWSTRGRPLVWVVDDSATERAITIRTLGSEFEIEQFTDGTEVVERIGRGSELPVVMLLDWEMPGMRGDEVCRFVRSDVRANELPIILVTASRVETADVVQGLDAGANDYVARPFAAAELRARVAAVLRAKDLTDAAAREHARLAAINRLGRALFQTASVVEVLEELGRSLVAEVCDGCSVMLLPGDLPPAFTSRHRADETGEGLAAISSLADPAVYGYGSSAAARAELPPAYHPYIDRFGLRALAILPFPILAPITGVVTLTRDGDWAPFERADLDAIETCIEYASLAVQSAMRFEAERVARGKLDVLLHFQEQMLGIVGHDLRSPLGAILTGAELLFANKIDPKVSPVAKRIRNSAERMARIVDQLLDVTRARLGNGIPVSRREVELQALVQGVVEEVALAHPAANFVLEDGSAAIVGLWDPDRLGQVIANLAANAAHYGKASAPITIRIAAGETEGVPQAILRIHNVLRDEPIPPDRLATLFDPYRRGRDAERHASGLGLGLYIVHEIVAAHRGSVTVASDPTGTTFTVVLPRR